MKKILIVEDDSFLKNLESAKFTHEGFEVVTTSSEKETVEMLPTIHPDIILLDLMLPDVDGLSLLEKIRNNETTKTTPIIVFSNVADENQTKRALEMGANDFMLKSNFTLGDIIEKIHAIIK